MIIKKSIKSDLPKLMQHAQWLMAYGFVEKTEGDYLLSFTKDPISIIVYYGRYSDEADVFVKIDNHEAERHENGEAYRYSIFEFMSVNCRQHGVDRSDGYETARFGLELLRENAVFFELDFLKDIRKKYLELLSKRLPETLRNMN